MGFGENGAKRAAMATNNTNADAAMEWVFAHMEDANFNDPLPEATAEGAAPPAPAAAADGPSEEVVGTLMSFGFTRPQVEAALKSTGNSQERAADWLFSHSEDMDAAVNSCPHSVSTFCFHILFHVPAPHVPIPSLLPYFILGCCLRSPWAFSCASLSYSVVLTLRYVHRWPQ
jgi:hypothetical protein